MGTVEEHVLIVFLGIFQVCCWHKKRECVCRGGKVERGIHARARWVAERGSVRTRDAEWGVLRVQVDGHRGPHAAARGGVRGSAWSPVRQGFSPAGDPRHPPAGGHGVLGVDRDARPDVPARDGKGQGLALHVAGAHPQPAGARLPAGL